MYRHLLQIGRLGLRAVALAGLLLAAPHAGALTIDDIQELYFSGPSGFGFDPGAVTAAGFNVGFVATADDEWIDAGNVSLGLPIQITQGPLEIYQDPGATGGVPDADDPFIADSQWTVRNASGRTLLTPLLVFTTLDPGGVYPEIPTGLDGDLLQILRYSFGGTDYLFGVVVLPDLEDGESADFTVRYVMAGPLAGESTDPLMAPLGVMGLGSYLVVPEPAVVVMGLGGLVGLLLGARLRPSSRLR